MGVFSSSGALFNVTALQAALEDSKIRLFDASKLENVTTATTLAELVAAEATYSGYASGGIAVEAWNDPIVSGDGFQIVSPLVQFNFVAPGSGTPVLNTIGGWFLVDSTSKLIAAGAFADGIPMIDNTSGIPLALTLREGNQN